MKKFGEIKSRPKNFQKYFHLEIDFLEGPKYSRRYSPRAPTLDWSSEVLALKMYFWRIFKKFEKIPGGSIGGPLRLQTGSRIHEMSFPNESQLIFGCTGKKKLVKISNAAAIVNFEVGSFFEVE